MKRIFLFITATILVFASCKKAKEDVPEFLPGDKGILEVEFDNIIGGQNLVLNTGNYTNASGESYTVSMLNYYISNMRLHNENGSEYVVPKDSSYFLIREEAPSQTITLKDIPAGNYTGISFTIGIDSFKSTAPLSERTGVLDPAGAGAGMYWTWNSGYIFVKFEGTSPAATTADKKFRYHIGGFGGFSSSTINNIKSVKLTAPAGSTAKVRKDAADAPHIHIFANAAKMLSGTTNVSFATNTTVMFAPYSVNVANNYTSMFNIDHIHND